MLLWDEGIGCRRQSRDKQLLEEVLARVDLDAFDLTAVRRMRGAPCLPESSAVTNEERIFLRDPFFFFLPNEQVID